MSDNWITLIPTDPNLQPTAESAERARTLLTSFVPRAQEIELEFTDNPQFIGPCGNWEGVACPACGANAEPWWSDAVGRAYVTGFTDLSVTAPCCNARLSLNDLNYIPPAGFARFVLSAQNPYVEDLSPPQMQQLETCLGCRLRRIWAHI